MKKGAIHTIAFLNAISFKKAPEQSKSAHTATYKSRFLNKYKLYNLKY